MSKVNKYREQVAAAQQARRLERMCLSKSAYASAADARQKGQRTYQCPFCKLWHRSGSLARLAASVKRRHV